MPPPLIYDNRLGKIRPVRKCPKPSLLLVCNALLVSSAASRSDPPPGYYTAAEGESGAALRQALHQVLHNHTVIPYGSGTRFDTSDALKALDQDPTNTNNVIGIYSRQSEPASSFGLTTGWNREHLWCDSYGLDGREPAYSDLHNLRAEDANVNSSRGNKFFDISDTNSAGYRMPAYAEGLLPIIAEIKRAHVSSLREIARCLNARGFKTPNGKAFAAQSVKNVVDRTTTLSAC